MRLFMLFATMPFFMLACGNGTSSSTPTKSVDPATLTGRPSTVVCGVRPPGRQDVQRPTTDAGDGGTEAGTAPSMPNIKCYADVECTEGKDGRCITDCGGKNFGGGACQQSQRCTYTTCTQDSECSGKDVCECDNMYGHACVPSTCRVDRDCAGGLPCTRASDGYHCRSQGDDCVVNADCPPKPDTFGQACDYVKSLGRWSCVDVTPPAP